MALCAKWIIRALTGDEAWKILVRHCISSGFPVNRPAWKGIGFHTLLIMREPVVIQGSFVIKSIWKAWEAIKPWLRWAGDEFRNGLSLNQQNIWWSPLFAFQGNPLAKTQGVCALRFFKRGIRTVKDLFSRVTMSFRTWEDMQVQYRLVRSDRQTFDLLLSSIPVHLVHKVGIQSGRPWWQDWKWFPDTPLANYKPYLGYRWLSPHLPMVDSLNKHWHLQSSLSQWRKRFDTIWSAITEPKIAHFAWCLAFQGLPLGPRLKHIGVPDPRCPFCGQPESFLHLFWFCKRAQNY